MQPADIAIALRRRSPWEAMDLGLSMLQRWGRLVYVPHLAVFAATAACAFGLAWWLERPWVALLAVWWLKPLGDRVVLHVLSRAVFGERLGWRAALSQYPQWLFTGLLTSLLLRWWPNLARSFYLPVRQLEGSRGHDARERRTLLGRRMHGYAVWLTLACILFEWLVLYLSFSLAAFLFLPAKASETMNLWDAVFAGEFWTWSDVFAYATAVAVLEPFYAAAGFALYLNRRSGLEGWDIEVALRKLAERHAAVAAAILLSVCVLFRPEVSFAQKNPRHEIREVLKAPEFPHEVPAWEWRARNTSDPRRSGGADLTWLEALVYALSNAARVILWVAAGAAIAYAIWWAARLMPRARASRAEPYRPPSSLFGMDLAPETLPDDVAAAAAALAAEGKLREALGLLYRGALSELVHRRGVMLLPSHTEGEVLRLSPEEKKNFMKSLIDAWRRCAYARQALAPGEVERLASDYRTFSSSGSYPDLQRA